MKEFLSDDNQASVPWLKEFYETVTQEYPPIRVDWCKFSPKGLILHNTEFAKAFIFKEQKLYRLLKEAIEYFKSENSYFPAFYMKTNETGQIVIYQEDKEPVKFHENSSKEIHLQSFETKPKMLTPMANPFITKPLTLPHETQTTNGTRAKTNSKA